MSSISHLNTDANNHADEKHADENASGMLVEHSEPTTPADLGPHDAPPTDIVQVKMTHGNKTVNHFFQAADLTWTTLKNKFIALHPSFDPTNGLELEYHDEDGDWVVLGNGANDWHMFIHSLRRVDGCCRGHIRTAKKEVPRKYVQPYDGIDRSNTAGVPAEVLHIILMHLQSSPGSLYRCLTVSRTWFPSVARAMWSKPTIRAAETGTRLLASLNTQGHLLPYASLIQHLDFNQRRSDASNQITDDLVIPLVRFCKDSLQYLSLGMCRKISHTTLRSLSSFRLQLTHFNVSDCMKITPDAFLQFIRSQHKMEVLDVGGCKGVNDPVLEEIAQHCPHLRAINLSSCRNVNDVSVRNLVKKCRHLVHLNISHTKITPTALSEIANTIGSQLRSLDVSYCTINASSLCGLLNCCRSLRSLNLSAITTDSESVASLLTSICNEISGSIHLKYLTHISLSSFTTLSDTDIIRVIQHVGPNLKHLDLSDCPLLSDSTVLTVANSCQNLLFISCRGFTSLTDSATPILAQSCAHLEQINLSSCPNLSANTVWAIAQHCKNLISLNVGGCKGRPGIGIETLKDLCERCGRLETVRVASVGLRKGRVAELAETFPDVYFDNAL